MKTYSNTAAALVAIAAANQAGFTVSAKTLNPIVDGYAVAVADTQNSFGSAGLARVIEFVKTHHEVTISSTPAAPSSAALGNLPLSLLSSLRVPPPSPLS